MGCGSDLEILILQLHVLAESQPQGVCLMTCSRLISMFNVCLQGKVVWEGPAKDFDTTEVPIVKQFRTGSLSGPISFD